MTELTNIIPLRAETSEQSEGSDDDCSLNLVDLSEQELRGTDFSGEELVGAKFTDADLSDCSFVRANLDGADFTNALIVGTDFTNADLRGVTFDGAYLEGALRVCPGVGQVQNIGPLGISGITATFYNTTEGIHVRSGAFFGSLLEFQAIMLVWTPLQRRAANALLATILVLNSALS